MQTDKRSCRPWRPIVKATASSALLACLLAAGLAQAQMYRWVDGNGRVHYTDTPPPTYQKSGGDQLNKQGLVIKRTQSEAERRAEAERLEEQKRVQLEQQRQAQLDRALTQTYTSEAEIDLARDRALEHHKLAIRGAQTRAAVVDKNMADLRGRIATIEQAGRKVGSGLTDQLAQAQRERQELSRTIQSNEDAMTKVREKYEADKLRYRELTARQ